MELFFLWFGLSIFFFVLEFFGRSIFLFLPLCLGALIIALASFFVPGVEYQVGGFLCVSVIFLMILRVFFGPERFQKTSFSGQLIGQSAVVTKTIVPALAGQVTIDGKVFDAQAAHDEIILVGGRVIVVGIKNKQVLVR